MILKLIMIISILIIILLLMMRKYLDSVKNEETVKTYEKMGELDGIYNKINIGIILSIATFILSLMIVLFGNPNEVIYCIYTIVCMLSLSYLGDNILNITCIKNSIKRQKINDMKREEANKDMEERFK